MVFISHFLGLVISRVLNVGYDNVWKISRKDTLMKIEGKSRNKEIGASEKKRKRSLLAKFPLRRGTNTSHLPYVITQQKLFFTYHYIFAIEFVEQDISLFGLPRR